jgi:hypothetical protein
MIFGNNRSALRFIDENGGGPGLRLKKRQTKKVQLFCAGQIQRERILAKRS